MTPVIQFNMLRRRSRVGLLLSLAIIVAMVWQGHLDAAWGKWVTYLGTCAALVFAILQLPGSSSITLDTDGISIRSPFWKQKLDWRNLRGFVLVDFSREGPEASPHRCWIGYLVSDPQRQAMPEETLKVFAPLGCHGLLPRIDRIDPKEMVRLLNGVLSHYRAADQEKMSS